MPLYDKFIKIYLILKIGFLVPYFLIFNILIAQYIIVIFGPLGQKKIWLINIGNFWYKLPNSPFLPNIIII